MELYLLHILIISCLTFANVRSQQEVENDIELETDPFEDIIRSLHEEPIEPVKTSSRLTVSTSWITQKLDHFNESDKRTWQMRYKFNEFFFQNGGPIFIFVGAEWEISDAPLTAGPIYTMAKEHNAYLFYTEHRYYGESHPTDNISSKNLRYLKVEQALADLETFIRTIKVGELANSKVILIGGSLSAAMVTWFRRIYPDLTVGGWASSGPLKLQIDFYEFKEVAGEAVRSVGGEKCYRRIENAFHSFARGIEKKNKTMINKVLKLCSNFDASNKYDVYYLFAALGDVFGGFIQGHKAGGIESLCSKIMETDDASGVAKWIRMRLKIEDCVPVSYKNVVKVLRGTKWTKKGMARQWFYQTCTQFGWFHTFSSDKQPFGHRVPLEYHEKFCRDIFGKELTLDRMVGTTEELNTVYGGLNPEVENMYYTHGYLDPWRPLGIQENETNVKVVPGYAHCKDLKYNKADTDDMLALRKDISNTVKIWLGTGNGQ